MIISILIPKVNVKELYAKNSKVMFVNLVMMDIFLTIIKNAKKLKFHIVYNWVLMENAKSVFIKIK